MLNSPETTGQQTIKAFHWTEEKNVTGITDTNGSGLKPTAFIGYVEWEGLKKISETLQGPYAFCLMGSPFPLEWKNHPEVFRTLVAGKSHFVKFDLTSSDNAYVLDFGIAAPFLHDGFLRGFYSNPESKRYLNSMVPLSEYHGGYSLPELILTDPIAPDRLTLVDGDKLRSKVFG